MFALRLAAWSAFAFAALSGMQFVNSAFVPFLTAGISLLVAGILFLALDRVITLLASIRDALIASPNAVDLGAVDGARDIEPRTLGQIEADIARIKGRA